jgi:heavy metal sensor kinase
MKSIRLSLMVYFLGLLTLALGAASWFVYETAHQSLLDKQGNSEKLVETQYHERCHDEANKLDEQLLAEAQTFSTLVRFKLDRRMIHGRELNLLNIAGLVAAPASPAPPSVVSPLMLSPTDSLGLAGVTSWSGVGVGPYLGTRWERASDVYRRYYDDYFRRLREFQFNEYELGQDSERRAEYFQIDGGRLGSYHSESLEKLQQSLPLDPTVFDKDKIPDWKYDEVKLTSRVTVRRVVLKTPFATNVPFIGPGPQWPGQPRDSSRGAPPPPDTAQRPPLYIQCAYDVTARDQALKPFADSRDKELRALGEQTDASLSDLRKRLLLMNAVTFAATVGGTWLLVWLGLLPLRRLSEAVSQVSEKDFRLPFTSRRLPAELRPIVERLNQTLAQLKGAFAREKQATADISHELRTPLAALLTTMEVALRKPRTAEEYRELLEDCQVSGQQMNRAVERLLALARLDAGVAVMRPERVDVSALAEQCAALVRPLAEARGLSLRVHGGDGAQLVADPDKLREVITNLLHNAIQYNRPQGSVEVSVGRENGRLRVEVSDTGVGIPAEAREHIFERFYRADPSRGEDGLHAGLGLAIVKGYVDLMGGTIRVESAEGRGSTFRLELPVERPRGAAAARN